ncbi:hypothetical protein [Pedobacter flavus]|uniref:Carboxypeptidase-like regulatory domain-containing protein n=1 Tax=Pedobacter flavus TaxID=3113906 RepID=A0ABU7GZQ0_9SPHI|nr:hypothetical protein [Pedobacter sp. VNH31]MEE1884258.1 hypothetical protein [Pedobacter sp. VNH31]
MSKEILDFELLEAYLDGKLSSEEMYFVEREALEDPFVYDALEGLSNSSNRIAVLSSLQKQLRARIAAAPAKKERWRIETHRLSIAATAALLCTTATIIYWMQGNFNKEDNKPVEVNLTEIGALKGVEKIGTVGALKDSITLINKSNAPVVASIKQQTTQKTQEIPASENVVAARSSMSLSSAESNIIKGKISDELTGSPIKGAQLIRKSDGFKLDVPPTGEFSIESKGGEQDVFIIKAVGYVPKEIKITTSEEAKISLRKEI